MYFSKSTRRWKRRFRNTKNETRTFIILYFHDLQINRRFHLHINQVLQTQQPRRSPRRLHGPPPNGGRSLTAAPGRSWGDQRMAKRADGMRWFSCCCGWLPAFGKEPNDLIMIKMELLGVVYSFTTREGRAEIWGKSHGSCREVSCMFS